MQVSTAMRQMLIAVLPSCAFNTGDEILKFA